jgi:hypothetical protein
MSPDSERAYFLYRYVLLNLGVIRAKSSGKPVANQISSRVGKGEDSKISRLIRFLDSEQQWETSEHSNQKVTAGDLVNLLASLRKNLKQGYAGGNKHYRSILTQEEILLALYKLIELTYEERKALGLQNGDGFTLLKQTLLTLQSSSGAEWDKRILQNYKAAIGLDPFKEDQVIGSLSQVNEYIEESVTAALRYLAPDELAPDEPDDISNQVIVNLTDKVRREIRNLLACNGISRLSTTDKHPYIQKYLQPAFIKKLTQTLINNERLTAQFPVYLTRVTIEACGPLPFAEPNLESSKSTTPYRSLLNEDFQYLDEQELPSPLSKIPGPSEYQLASQGASKIVLEFYLKVPASYISSIPETFDGLADTNRNADKTDKTDKTDKYRRIDFTMSSTGIGGTLSHATKVVNTTLLAEIACLNSFFPTAHDVTAIRTIVGDNVSSPVWAHSLVKLCKKDALGEALKKSKKEEIFPYDNFSFGDPIGRGDFCGFDFLTTQVQASIQSRLQAVKNAGVNPQDYIAQLCKKVEKHKALEQAQQHLTGYPFSTLAMVSVIQKSILGEMPDQEQLSAEDPHIYFIACLSIAEVLLQEGAYRKAGEYLKKIEVLETYAQDSLKEVDDSEERREKRKSFVTFSGTLIVRYLLCWATYYYLFDDTEDSDLPDKFKSGVSRRYLVEAAWETLEQAYKHVDIRFKRYLVLDEISQGTLHPHYELLSRIYSTRAKLLFFFPDFSSKYYREQDVFPNSIRGLRLPALLYWGRLYLMEQARLYAAADGNNDNYAIFAAIQSCLYLIAAYAEPNNLSFKGRDRNLSLIPRRCIGWARSLRNHALIAYADTGRQCYYSIKQKSGLSKDLRHHNYGDFRIFAIPTIFEFEDSELEHSRLSNSQESSSTGKPIKLDMSLLCVDIGNLPKLTPKHPTENIYLFGANACYLFFARGLFLLCSDTTDEDFEGSKGKSKVQSTEQWEDKLKKALRLFDMAWAIAEDGGKISKNTEESSNSPMAIKRYPPEQDRGDQYTSPEIDDVRDLYLCRISEIADLGKILSAACMTLYLHTLPFANRHETEENIRKIFSMLHGEYNLEDSRELLNGQKRFNGHLADKFKEAEQIIRKQKGPQSDQPSLPDTIKDCRDQLMRKLFALTHCYPNN